MLRAALCVAVLGTLSCARPHPADPQPPATVASIPPAHSSAPTGIASSPVIPDAGAPDAWPPAPPNLTGLPKLPPGAAQSVWVRKVASGGASEAMDSWSAAMQAAGWQLVARHRSRWSADATFAHNSGVRVIATIGAGQGELSAALFVVPNPVPPRALQNPCIAIPDEAYTLNVNASGIDQRGHHHQNTVSWGFETSYVSDFDGDGVLDAWVPDRATIRCPEDVFHTIYVMRGACGHNVGRVGPGQFERSLDEVGVDGSGFKPVVMSSQHTENAPVPISVLRRTRLAFDGSAYRQVATDESRGRCHHCGWWTCSPAQRIP